MNTEVIPRKLLQATMLAFSPFIPFPIQTKHYNIDYQTLINNYEHFYISPSVPFFIFIPLRQNH